jgi:hypothetical protein
MSTYEPGQVAVATVRGVPNVRVWRKSHDGIAWLSAVAVGGSILHSNEDVTDIRPLVVLDHSHILDAVNGLDTALYDFDWFSDDERSAVSELRDLIEQQTKPPRIPEPGLWGVVEAAHALVPTRRWVHHEEDRWVADEGTVTYWVELRDPTLIRPGIEATS